jgi:hypothetical protein
LEIQGLDESLKQLVGADLLHQATGRSLRPGESLISFVCTNSDDSRVADAVRGSAEKLTYRIRLRNGFTAWRGQEVATNVVAGIEFSPNEIHSR